MYKRLVVMASYRNVFFKKKSTLISLIAMIHPMAVMLVSTRPSPRLSKLDYIGQPFSKMSIHMYEHVIDAKEPKT